MKYNSYLRDLDQSCGKEEEIQGFSNVCCPRDRKLAPNLGSVVKELKSRAVD